MTDPNPGPQWADVLTLREEVRATDGSVGELQMSLAKAVYQTVQVPYTRCAYYTEITQPTPLLIGFLGRVARRLGVLGLDSHAAFHLDQGMGGGKSHALVGIWHMINDPDTFFSSDLGRSVIAAAGAGGHAPTLDDVVPVILIGDSMSPGRTDPRFGPASDLFGRFLWLAFEGHRDRLDRWQHYNDLGANKATLQAVFAELNRPVLVVIDELMDYAMALTDATAIGGLPGEQAFLNALTDAVDDQPQVALVIVMIRSDEDAAGYHPAAEDMREYLSARLQRNGETVTVTEPADFAQIIRRRLFEHEDIAGPAARVADAFIEAASDPWDAQVYAKLGGGRSLSRFTDRVPETYPFHPDLFELVAREWSRVQAFQRVRSTVAIFARTVLHWLREHEDGRWVPELIGPGDIPIHTDALEALLSSGVLAGNERAIQGYRAVANTDIVRSGGGAGTAYALDTKLSDSGVQAGQPAPAVRMATACFVYSLVSRAQGARGATKAELLASVDGPNVPYPAAEEVFNGLIAGPSDGGLGALEHTRAATRSRQDRYYLSIKQTLTMYHANAMGTISTDIALDQVWQRAQHLAAKGPFTTVHVIEPPVSGLADAATCFAGVDGQENRLVVLDPRRWTLLNGRDAATRADLDITFGVAPGLAPTYAASLVVSLVNTQRRGRASARAKQFLAWDRVVAGMNPDDEEYAEAAYRRDRARTELDDELRAAFQHYGFLLRTNNGLAVQYRTLPDGRTSLNGQDVWNDLIDAGRAVKAGALAAAYVGGLISSGNYGRHLTPREIFAQPYSNPVWPLVPTDNDLRQAVFELATGAQWMLTDSDGAEIQPATPGQIQPGSVQQVLRPRVIDDVPSFAADGTASSDRQGSSRAVLDCPAGAAVNARGSLGSEMPPEALTTSYEITRISLPVTSLTQDSARDAMWQLFREVASLLDAARRVDVQLVDVDISLTAAAGQTADLQNKARAVPGAIVTVEADDM